MRLSRFLLITVPILITACAGGVAALDEDQRSFLKQYQAYCGEAYAGETTMVDLGDNSVFEGAELLVIFEECTDTHVRLPFFVDDDESRTWQLDVREEGLRLAHDHRDEDGQEEPANMYGGFADEQGSAMKQFFPADERTVSERPSRNINVWSKEFDLENHRYYYRLYLDGELRFEAMFDLTTPVQP